MTVLVNRRDLVVAAVAAAVGGGVVAGAFAAASLLKESPSLFTESQSAPGNVMNPESTDKCILQWVREWFRHVSTKLGTSTGVEHVGGISKIWGSVSHIADDNIWDQKNQSVNSAAQMSRSCDLDTRSREMDTSGGPCDNVTNSLCKSSNSPTGAANVRADPFNPSKRTGYLSWDDYFMAIAFLSAQRSKDPNRQELDITASQGAVLTMSFRGLRYVCHAEVNAILNKNHASAAGQRLYVTMFPCNECAKLIIQARIAEVVYFTEKGQGEVKNAQMSSFVASRKLLAMAGVKVWQYKPLKRALVLEYR